MAGKKTSDTQMRGGGEFLPAFCNVLGVFLLVLVIGLCLPLTGPALFGYQVYNVVSGSMAPEIPTGSVVYVKPTEPSSVQIGDVIAFYDGGGVVAHRVNANHIESREFVTKGDANEIADINPVPYDSFIGKVEAHLPVLGDFMSLYASTVGKVYLLLTAACGVMLNVLAGRMRESRRARLRKLEETAAAVAEVSGGSGGSADAGAPDAGAPDAGASGAGAPGKRETASGSAGKKASSKRRPSMGTRVRHAVMVVLAVVFVGSGGVIGFFAWQYGASDALYHDASQHYTTSGSTAPISVDFEELKQVNPDVVGWIYCEGTPIDYPVMKGDDNDQYLHTDYTGAYNFDGSIFMDCDNSKDFTDSNTILYGHHMNSGAMFACLEQWASQDFYEEHPVIWLLTPDRDYKIVVFSAHHASAYSSYYDIIDHPGEQMDKFLDDAVADSDIRTNVQLNYKGRYVMLSTCAYLFDNDRYVVHGLLVTVARH